MGGCDGIFWGVGVKGLVRVIKSSKKPESRECGAAFIILQWFRCDFEEGCR